MQKDLNQKLPITEFLSFLAAAKDQCINSVLLEDFIAKVSVLKEQEQFYELLAKFNDITTIETVQSLENSGQVFVYSHNASTEVMLANPIEQAKVLGKTLTPVDWQLYLQMAYAYRTIKIDQKSPKIKGI